jgi:S-methylmethionine-dependent homocysteine/selenocysteine methylase
VVLSFLCTLDGRLYSGEELDDAVAAVLPLRPAGLAVNCVSARHIAVALEILHTTLERHAGVLHSPELSASFPLGVYANTGVAGEERNESMMRDVDPEEYAAFARRWIQAGASIVGGCCGTTPDYIRRLT